MNSVMLAPQVQLEQMQNLFIELTTKTCNLKCRHCYISQEGKKETDFISIETISKAIKDLSNDNLQMIYFTGAEPMLHPEFNSILRLCLKYMPVTIFTNAMCINEKKARFLSKVENEGTNPIIFRISIDHFEERKNDDLRGRGSFRKAMHAISALLKYNFTPYINVTNYYNLQQDEIIQGFMAVANQLDIDIEENNIIILPSFRKNLEDEQSQTYKFNNSNLDCSHSRTLNKNGVYACPFLSHDHRGRMGADFKDYARKTYLESDLCIQCEKYNQKIFVN